MVTISDAITIAAPYYNLALVLIVVALFIKLFRTKPTNPHIFIRPWYFLFAAIAMFIVEELTTVLRAAGVITFDVYINGYFELVIVSLIIYTLLLQREHLVKEHGH
jgi:hypothetical protein